MLKLALFLLSLVDADEAFIEDAGRDAQLKLVLFHIVVEKLNHANVRAFLLVYADADVARAQLVLLQRALELLGHLVHDGVVRRHLLCEPVECDHHGRALFNELCDFLEKKKKVRADLYRQSVIR